MPPVTIDTLTCFSTRLPKTNCLTAFVVAMACFLAGCTGGSVHPLLTEKELIDGPDLTGTWNLELVGPRKDIQYLTLQLEQFDTSTYDVDVQKDALNEKESKSDVDWPRDAWTLQVGKIDRELYGQLVRRDAPVGPPVFRVIPVYVFGRIVLDRNEFKFFPLLDTGCTAVAEREKLQHMSYELSEFDELTIFTMPTAELQKMVVKHGKDQFSPVPWVLNRVEDNTSEKNTR